MRKYFIHRYIIIIIYALVGLLGGNVMAQDEEMLLSVNIPEPLMFDLVRGLGAKQGELEINALADFPVNHISHREVEWAPEIEYALFDGFAVLLYKLQINNYYSNRNVDESFTQYQLRESKSLS